MPAAEKRSDSEWASSDVSEVTDGLMASSTAERGSRWGGRRTSERHEVALEVAVRQRLRRSVEDWKGSNALLLSSLSSLCYAASSFPLPFLIPPRVWIKGTALS